MAILARGLPAGRDAGHVLYDTTPFITASITDVVKTLIAAIALVFVVMLIFLQNIRATLIPTLVIPVALLGTFIGLSALHFSINQLDLFGMVLAIGIVVDDAIVVIENVERIMREEGLEPKEATRKAMGQITGAIIAITVVLAAVFMPSALQPGATGIIYSQFALTIAISMGFSAFLALSFTPSLCASILKPRITPAKECRVPLVQRGFDWVGDTYVGQSVAPCGTRRAGWLVFALIAVLAGFLYSRLPTQLRARRGSGLHARDRQPALGSAPAAHRCRSWRRCATRCMHSPIGKDIAGMFSAEGFSFVGQSENVGMAFIKLTDWSKRSQTRHAAHPAGQQDAARHSRCADLRGQPADHPRPEPVRRRRHVPAGTRRPTARRSSRRRRRRCSRKQRTSPRAVRHPPQLAAGGAAAASWRWIACRRKRWACR